MISRGRDYRMSYSGNKENTVRADRLVSILLWLQVHGRTSTADLARRLEVSPRTIVRDMDALTTCGVPVFALRGRNGGWTLPEEYRLGSKWLSTSEVRALAVLSPAHVLADLGLTGTAEAAWLKLLAALPPVHRDQATFVQERIHVDTSTWQPRRDTTPWLGLLKEAVFANRRVHLQYRRADRAPVSRTIEPLGLVSKGNIWYLIGQIDGECRSYRVSRIEAAELLAEEFDRPEGFDLASFWEASKARLAAGLPRYPATLRADPAVIESLGGRLRWGKVERINAPGPDGWHEVSIMFETHEDALASVLGFGDRVVVIDPPELRACVHTTLRSALARYEAASAVAVTAVDDMFGHVRDD